MADTINTTSKTSNAGVSHAPMRSKNPFGLSAKKNVTVKNTAV